ncbi:hypothetical protein [Streptomyces sp. NPDC126503]|uniref:hypothetical protein n=1 Tax=Streptomyces sp. NPDC126503 TaxID=3155315 RepID=UPI00332623D3
MPGFAITTTLGDTYREGQRADAVPLLAALGAGTETLDRFDHEADYVVLHFGDYTISIPESRIDQIAERSKA